MAGRDAVQLPPSGLDGKDSSRDEMVLGEAQPGLGSHCPLTPQSSLQSPVASKEGQEARGDGSSLPPFPLCPQALSPEVWMMGKVAWWRMPRVCGC